MKDIVVRLCKEKGINAKLDLGTESLSYKTPISSSEYREESIKMAVYLTTLKKPVGISRPEFCKFKWKALKHGVHRQKLWQLLTKGMPTRLVVDCEKTQAQILHDLHNQSRHRGRE